MSAALWCLLGFVVGSASGATVALHGRRLRRARRSLQAYRRELAGRRPGLAFYIVPVDLGNPDEVVAELTGRRRPRLCLIGRLCGPLPPDARAVPEGDLERGALWVAQGLLIFDPVRPEAEMSVLEAPYGVDAREPLLTEEGNPTVTLDLGDAVLVFEPAPDNDVHHAWSRIQHVLHNG